MRSIEDMIACRNAPVAPGSDGLGFALADLAQGECRFAVAELAGRVRFCAEPVADWAPGRVNGCYCEFHRAYLKRQPAALCASERANGLIEAARAGS